MVLALCILGVATVTLLLIAVVDRPKQRLSHPEPVALAQHEALPTTVGPVRGATLDPYVMR